MKKPELLFIHGFRGNHLGLLEVKKYFEAKGYKCYAPDIPPAYNTQKEKIPRLSEHTADGYAKWVADYILEKKWIKGYFLYIIAFAKSSLLKISISSIFSPTPINFTGILFSSTIPDHNSSFA